MRARDTIASQPCRPPGLAFIEVIRRIFGWATPAQTPTIDLESLPLAQPLTREEIAARQRQGRAAEISE